MRNEAILPGGTVGMAQSLAIGEDSSIVNVQAGSGPKMPDFKTDEADVGPDFWGLRADRHAWYMRLWKEEQFTYSLEVTKQFAALQSPQTAKSRLLEMLNNDELKKMLGDSIAGVPVKDVLEETRRDAFGASRVNSFGLL